MRLGVVLGLVLVLSGVGAIGVAAQGGPAASEPIQLFDAMMPTLKSPRCSNCHGATNALTGENHGGGEVSDVPVDNNGDMLPGTLSNEQCLECRDEPPPGGQPQVWRLAPKRMSFTGKDTAALCQQMRSLNELVTEDQSRKDKFIDHLSTDQLIGFAFEGRRGMLENSPLPPPMNRPSSSPRPSAGSTMVTPGAGADGPAASSRGRPPGRLRPATTWPPTSQSPLM